MMRLENRKGAIAVIVGVLMMVLMMLAAVAVDMTRLYAIRTDMHTLADAAALAAAVELLKSPGDGDAASVRAAEYGASNQNPVNTATIVAEPGRWVQVGAAPGHFEGGAGYVDAVRVQVTHKPASYLLARAFDNDPVQLTRTSIGWAGATTNEGGCMRPWALPYERLIQELDGGVPVDPRRDLTGEDVARLFNGELGDIPLVLKNSDADSAGVGVNETYAAVVLPAANSPGELNDGSNGAEYEAQISTAVCDETNRVVNGQFLRILTVSPGEVTFTRQGAEALCGPRDPASGQCAVPMAITIALTIPTGDPTVVEVKAVGKFMLEAVENGAQMHGRFIAGLESDPIALVKTPLLANRPLLVR